MRILTLFIDAGPILCKDKGYCQLLDVDEVHCLAYDREMKLNEDGEPMRCSECLEGTSG